MGVSGPFLDHLLASTQLAESGFAIGFPGHFTQHLGDGLGERNSIVE